MCEEGWCVSVKVFHLSCPISLSQTALAMCMLFDCNHICGWMDKHCVCARTHVQVKLLQLSSNSKTGSNSKEEMGEAIVPWYRDNAKHSTMCVGWSWTMYPIGQSFLYLLIGLNILLNNLILDWKYSKVPNFYAAKV